MIITLVVEQLFEFLGLPGTLYLFAIITFLGAIFVFCFIKETARLNHIQKKELYIPPELKTASSLPTND